MTVVKLDHATGRADVRKRVGSVYEFKWVPFSALATTHEAVFQKLNPFLSAITSRAALTNEPVQTEAAESFPTSGPSTAKVGVALNQTN